MSSVEDWTALWLQIMYRISPLNKLGQNVYLFTLDGIDLPHGHFVVIYTSDSLMVANIQMVSLLNSVLKHTPVFVL